jgi:ABC-type taurine transport system ATPase subunit
LTLCSNHLVVLAGGSEKTIAIHTLDARRGYVCGPEGRQWKSKTA